ncbi:MAG: RNA-binding S4 domain-containing protein [Gammaproteobacteria bacterium]|nr:RNA-binding S4 domain-containing protein [Gammaproteobacteria bacterium]
MNAPLHDQRLDKWLWCARLYKTRSLAQEAINAGHVLVDGRRAKPARTISAGMHISLRKPPYEFHLEVTGLVPQRVGAPVAQTLYRESAESLTAREALVEQLRMTSAGERAGVGRPDRRDRREIAAFKRGVGSED